MHYVTRNGTGLILVASLALFACSGKSGDASVQQGAVQLMPHSTPLPEPTIRRTVYVPVYSSIYLGIDIKQQNTQLAATVSTRNVSAQHPVVLNFVRYTIPLESWFESI